MTLPLRMPFAPIEALSVEEIPVGPEWQYEPKWDGFRTLAFADGKKARVTIEVRPLHDAVFPGSGRGIAGAGAEKIRARRRDRRSLRRRLFLRRAVAARPSGGEPGAQACGGDAGHIHRLRSSRRCRRTWPYRRSSGG